MNTIRIGIQNINDEASYYKFQYGMYFVRLSTIQTNKQAKIYDGMAKNI